MRDPAFANPPVRRWSLSGFAGVMAFSAAFYVLIFAPYGLHERFYFPPYRIASGSPPGFFLTTLPGVILFAYVFIGGFWLRKRSGGGASDAILKYLFAPRYIWITGLVVACSGLVFARDVTSCWFATEGGLTVFPGWPSGVLHYGWQDVAQRSVYCHLVGKSGPDIVVQLHMRDGRTISVENWNDSQHAFDTVTRLTNAAPTVWGDLRRCPDFAQDFVSAGAGDARLAAAAGVVMARLCSRRWGRPR